MESYGPGGKPSVDDQGMIQSFKHKRHLQLQDLKLKLCLQ